MSVCRLQSYLYKSIISTVQSWIFFMFETKLSAVLNLHDEYTITIQCDHSFITLPCSFALAQLVNTKYNWFTCVLWIIIKIMIEKSLQKLLHTMWFAGGLCFLPSTRAEALRLFEMESLLTLKDRHKSVHQTLKAVTSKVCNTRSEWRGRSVMLHVY